MSTMHEAYRKLQEAAQARDEAEVAVTEVQERIREYRSHLIPDPDNPPAYLKPTLGSVTLDKALYEALAEYYEASRLIALAKAEMQQVWLDAWSKDKQ